MPRIVLIGPIMTGKSTIARMLSRRIGVRNVPLDLVRWGYYYGIGYDREVEFDLVKRHGNLARFEYWKPFEAHAVEGVLADYPNAIIDFGAGHSVYDDPALFARVERALKAANHVILILPTPDIESSVSILVERDDPPAEFVDEFKTVVRGMLENPSNGKLATSTVYTHGKTPEETCSEIAGIISSLAEMPGQVGRPI